ncbi:MAG: sulfatase-like hydrolase/transferase [Candidatus Hodarchaeota archaeon]
MKKRPNILFFMCDGLQGRALRDKDVKTPNIDRLCTRALSFDRAYTPTPTCSPARASLMTGLLAHNHGVLQVEHCVDNDQSVLRTDRRHWAQYLSDAGYCTGYFGKWHIERTFELNKFGWQVNGCDHSPLFLELVEKLPGHEEDKLDESIQHWQINGDGYRPILHYGVTDYPVAERRIGIPTALASSFLEEVLGAGQPWCCFVSYPDPNEAMVCSRETFKLYDVNQIELSPNLKDGLEGRPAMYRRTQQLWSSFTEQQWREAKICYYARITELDSQLSLLLDKIGKAGEMENTIVIIISDHGKYVGGHGMEAHNFGAFEEIYNIPMIISTPQMTGSRRSSARVGLHEIYSSLLDLLDIEHEPVPDSRSFAELVEDPNADEGAYQTGYGEYHGTRFPLMQRILWDGDWKFIFNGFDYDELYDLATDPYEMHNLADKPQYQERVKTMMKMAWEHIINTGDKSLISTHYYSMRFASVGPDSVKKKDFDNSSSLHIKIFK